MVSSINVALSGLNAAGTRLGVSANNIANQFSTTTTINGQTQNTPFKPQQVQQTALPGGGVRTQVVDANNPTTQRFAPTDPSADENGQVESPNVNLEQEIVNTITAGYDYRANLKVLKVQDNLQQSLLDIFG